MTVSGRDAAGGVQARAEDQGQRGKLRQTKEQRIRIAREEAIQKKKHKKEKLIKIISMMSELLTMMWLLSWGLIRSIVPVN